MIRAFSPEERSKTENFHKPSKWGTRDSLKLNDSAVDEKVLVIDKPVRESEIPPAMIFGSDFNKVR